MSSSTATPSRRQKIAVTCGTLGVLGAVTAGSWLMIDGTIEVQLAGDDSIPAGEECPVDTQSPVVPSRVPVVVLNTTNEPGLASDVAAELSDREFRVVSVDNDHFSDTRFESIIRAGDRGMRQAYTLQQHLPRALVDIDSRDDFTVDVVLGSDFEGMVEAEEVQMEPGRLDCSGNGS